MTILQLNSEAARSSCISRHFFKPNTPVGLSEIYRTPPLQIYPHDERWRADLTEWPGLPLPINKIIL